MKHRFISAMLAAAMALTAGVPTVSAADHTPLYTAPVQEMPLAQQSLDAESVYNAIKALEADYPTGMTWTNDNSYTWKGGIYAGGNGCAAFAFMLSDAAFGDLPARMTETLDPSAVRVGDILRYSFHSIIVLEVKESSIIAAEGNINSMVYWGREITFAEMEGTFEHHITRYPEGEPEPETTTTTTTTETTTTTTTTTTATTTTTTETTTTTSETSTETTTTTEATDHTSVTTTTSLQMTPPEDDDCGTTTSQTTVVDPETDPTAPTEPIPSDASFAAMVDVVTVPTKTLYGLNERLDLTGMEVDVYHSYMGEWLLVMDGVNPLDYPDEFTISGFDSSTPEMDAEITLTYGTFNHVLNEDVRSSDSFAVNIVDLSEDPDRYTADIRVESWAEKLEYIPGEELDLTGMSISVIHNYAAGSEFAYESINPQDHPELFSIEGYDPYTSGTQTVLVVYEGFNTAMNEDVRCAVSFEVTVGELFGAEDFTAEVEICSAPVKTLYEPDQQLDTTGLYVNVWHHYSDGTDILVCEKINPLDYSENFTISAIDPELIGTQTITVHYTVFNHQLNEDVHAYAEFNIENVDLEAEPDRFTASMQLNALPEKLEYTLGEELDLTGISVTAIHSYGRVAKAEYLSVNPQDHPEAFTIEGYDPEILGEQEVLIVYNGFNADMNEDVRAACSFKVNVIQAASNTLGDANRDGSCDASDAAMVLVAAAAVGAGNESGLTAEQEADMDVDFDGDFDAADAAIILTYAAYIGSGGTLTLPEYLAG